MEQRISKQESSEKIRKAVEISTQRLVFILSINQIAYNQGEYCNSHNDRGKEHEEKHGAIGKSEKQQHRQ